MLKSFISRNLERSSMRLSSRNSCRTFSTAPRVVSLKCSGVASGVLSRSITSTATSLPRGLPQFRSLPRQGPLALRDSAFLSHRPLLSCPRMEYEAVIGLETHVQLKTRSKMWCGCANEFGAPPNTNVCPICLGMPGVLPVANDEALKLTVLTGLLLNCNIPRFAKFDRKNYFYPDASKNYQVTQYDKPSTEHGYVDFEFQGSTSR